MGFASADVRPPRQAAQPMFRQALLRAAAELEDPEGDVRVAEEGSALERDAEVAPGGLEEVRAMARGAQPSLERGLRRPEVAPAPGEVLADAPAPPQVADAHERLHEALPAGRVREIATPKDRLGAQARRAVERRQFVQRRKAVLRTDRIDEAVHRRELARRRRSRRRATRATGRLDERRCRRLISTKDSGEDCDKCCDAHCSLHFAVEDPAESEFHTSRRTEFTFLLFSSNSAGYSPYAYGLKGGKACSTALLGTTPPASPVATAGGGSGGGGTGPSRFRTATAAVIAAAAAASPIVQWVRLITVSPACPSHSPREIVLAGTWPGKRSMPYGKRCAWWETQRARR